MLSRIEYKRSEFTSLRTQMEDLVDSFFGNLSSRYFIPVVGAFADGRVSENEREFILEIALPDLKPEDIDVSVKGNFLTMQIKQVEKFDKTSSGAPGRRTITRTTTRNLRLPVGLQNDRIGASYADGLLKIILPKKEKSPQRIQIRTDNQNSSHD